MLALAYTAHMFIRIKKYAPTTVVLHTHTATIMYFIILSRQQNNVQQFVAHTHFYSHNIYAHKVPNGKNINISVFLFGRFSFAKQIQMTRRPAEITGSSSE